MNNIFHSIPFLKIFVFLFLHTPICIAEKPSSAWIRHTIDGTSQGADGVRLSDVNGDWFPDIATGWEQGNIVRVYLHPGIKKVKNPWPYVTVVIVGDPEDAVFADIDGDGSVDVVSSCE